VTQHCSVKVGELLLVLMRREDVKGCARGTTLRRWGSSKSLDQPGRPPVLLDVPTDNSGHILHCLVALKRIAHTQDSCLLCD
jgi:hypothetical protein